MKYEKRIEGNEVVFLLHGIIEVRIPKKFYEICCKRYGEEGMISFCPYKNIYNALTGRRLYYISKESNIPLIGHSAFGIIDRGTNLLQVRPITGCNLNCIFCSVDEGISRTRVTDYIVDLDYLLEEFEKIAEFKRKYCKSIEAHIDGQGEPFLYPWIEELIKSLSKVADVVSIQTNGTLITKEMIKKLDGYLDRINLSIHSLNEEKAKLLVGKKDYELQHIIEIAEEIVSSNIDLLLAPVWIPGYNDDEIPKIIEFGKKIGAGKKWKAFGIQKFVRYRFGRIPKGVKRMDFKTFFKKLAAMNKDLILSPEDFGIIKCRELPKKFRVGEKVKLKLEMYGRIKDEMIAIARERVIQVVDTNKKIGEYVKARITRNKDNIYVAKEI
ncbi:MAG: radical SAM protein [Thermoplasmata archaeon]|nr:radical SAM protein [Thermoplasmata archaeon]